LTSRLLDVPDVPSQVTLELHGIGQARADQRLSEFDLQRSAEGAYDVRLRVTNDDRIACARFATV
jgi:DNA-nicking Smr family endonuclease